MNLRALSDLGKWAIALAENIFLVFFEKMKKYGYKIPPDL
jgi:hypothetical protein